MNVKQLRDAIENLDEWIEVTVVEATSSFSVSLITWQRNFKHSERELVITAREHEEGDIKQLNSLFYVETEDEE